jgi:hypothetical protein
MRPFVLTACIFSNSVAASLEALGEGRRESHLPWSDQVLMTWPIANFNPEPLLLWSTSNRVVHFVSSRYLGRHYVWCTPVFEGRAVARYAPGFTQPASSDPATIYRNLLEAVRTSDEHNPDMVRQKTTLSGLALKLSTDGEISFDTAAEIVAYLDAAHISDWKPLIYVIPYAGVRARVEAVPRAERASAEMEYVIPNLGSAEFEIIEPMSC